MFKINFLEHLKKAIRSAQDREPTVKDTSLSEPSSEAQEEPIDGDEIDEEI